MKVFPLAAADNSSYLGAHKYKIITAKELLAADCELQFRACHAPFFPVFTHRKCI